MAPSPAKRRMPSTPNDSSPPHRKGHVYFGRKRSKQDDLAHAEAEALSQNPIPDHPLIPRDAPSLVADDDALIDLLAHLRSTGGFAYDSEFIGERSYHPKFCVIQVATPTRVALIDALSGVNLADFWELLTDPGVEKIVHAGEQDLEPVMRHTGRPAANVFDTQIAAAFIGHHYPVSLSKLVQEILGVALGKGLKFSQWDRRPLSPVQVHYAANDVRFLPALRAELRTKLDAVGNAGRADEDCAAACLPADHRADPALLYTKFKGTVHMRSKHLAALRELAVWRDREAREMDVPPRMFLKDQVLLALSRYTPKSVDDLVAVEGLPRPVRDRFGQTIIDIVAQATSLPADQRPVPSELRETERDAAIIDRAWAEIQERCRAASIDPAVVTSRRELSQLHGRLRRGHPAHDSRLLTGWRYDMFRDLLAPNVEPGDDDDEVEE